MTHAHNLLSHFTNAFQAAFNFVEHHTNLEDSVSKLQDRCKFLESQLDEKMQTLVTEVELPPTDPITSTDGAVHE